MKFLIVFFLFFQLPLHSFAWGFFAHKKINELAVYCLPHPLFGLFKQHIDYLSEHAVDPDKRRYLLADEGARHFLDVDYYENSFPLDSIPHNYREACNKYSEDTIKSYGIVPWNIQWKQLQLIQAMKEKDLDRTLKIAAELGHYIADAHVPLHSTSNYNGQKTGQTGIHAFFESRLPELFFSDYDFFLKPAVYVYHPDDEVWKMISESYKLLDSVLWAENYARTHIPENLAWTYESKGYVLQKIQSVKYSSEFHLQLRGIVERRMREAVWAVSCFWYSAWIDAGMPNISDFKKKESRPDNLFFSSDSLPAKMIGRQEN